MKPESDLEIRHNSALRPPPANRSRLPESSGRAHWPSANGIYWQRVNYVAVVEEERSPPFSFFP